MCKSCASFAFAAALFSVVGSAQDATSGVSVPVTISGEGRWNGSSDDPTTTNGGLRAVVAPTLKLTAHWFAYAAVDVHSSNYFTYQFGAQNDRPVEAFLTQALLGYTRDFSRVSILIKAGQMSTAFGLYPVEYDDAKSPLINPPTAYTASLPVRPDQLPCGVRDVLHQEYDAAVTYLCGGSAAERYGVTPATLYGLPALEVEASGAHLDGRLQLTNSSPVNPHGLLSSSQHTQWSAGGGYGFRGGLHLGLSGFRGPYLDNNLRPWLPSGMGARDYPAASIGVDARWSGGNWSFEGEWLRTTSQLPGFTHAPSGIGSYAAVKRIISPRVFVAARVDAQFSGSIADQSGATATHATGPQQVYELTLGYRLNRQQLIKLGGTWNHYDAWTSGWYWPAEDRYAIEIQLVNSFTPISKGFR